MLDLLNEYKDAAATSARAAPTHHEFDDVVTKTVNDLMVSGETMEIHWT